jgi:hypothetical protein
VSESVIMRYAEQSGKSVEEVRQIWDRAKLTAKERFPNQGEAYWDYVASTTKTILGLAKKNRGHRLRTVR